MLHFETHKSYFLEKRNRSKKCWCYVATTDISFVHRHLCCNFLKECLFHQFHIETCEAHFLEKKEPVKKLAGLMLQPQISIPFVLSYR